MKQNSIDNLFEYGVDVASRTIYMGDETNHVMAERFLKAMILLAPTPTPIQVIMNNLGGDEYHGAAIYDAIRVAKSPVEIFVYGHAMSMGSIILQAAGYRAMSENSKLMIHHGTPIAAESDFHVKQQEAWTKECKKYREWMMQVYLDRIREKHPNFTKRRLDKMLDFDTILSAREAVELGLADEVITNVR